MQLVLQSIPREKLFLETDTQALSIELVYTFAAASLDMSTEQLQNQLKKNTLTVFPSAFS
jgi:Tat protein secretion system quality control protein TatD with DNase activity